MVDAALPPPTDDAAGTGDSASIFSFSASRVIFGEGGGFDCLVASDATVASTADRGVVVATTPPTTSLEPSLIADAENKVRAESGAVLVGSYLKREMEPGRLPAEMATK